MKPYSYIATKLYTHRATQLHSQKRGLPALCGGGWMPPLFVAMCVAVPLLYGYVVMCLCGYVAMLLCGYVATDVGNMDTNPLLIID